MLITEARARIRELADLHAFITVSDEAGKGEIVAVKDLIDVRGLPTTGGGIILSKAPATEDAPLIKRLRAHGCVVVGKTNLHEFAFGLTSANPHYGDVLNPHDHSRWAGGSSGGSAVAVATRMCDWAVGTDTGGSIRIPASLCGVVGVKPTFGTISVDGVFPLSKSLDTVGALALDVPTAARALWMMTGRRELAVQGAPNLDGLRLGTPSGWIGELDRSTGRAWRKVSRGLPEISFPDRAALAAAGLTILFKEAAEVHRHWVATVPEKYGEDVLAHLRKGLAITNSEYRAALKQRDRLQLDAEAAMQDLDALLLPATACVAPKVGQTEVREPLVRFTRPFNTTGQPVVCLPAPTRGLPVGVQVVGHVGQDAHLLAVAATLELTRFRGQVIG